MKFVILENELSIIKSIMRGYYDALKAKGNSVLSIKIGQGLGALQINSILEFKPDFILTYGYNAMIKYKEQFLFRAINIPVIMLHYDCPLIGLNSEFDMEFKNHGEFYYNFIWDDYFLTIFKNKNYINCFKIFLAADEKRFYYNSNIIPKNAISFAGSVGAGFTESYTNSRIINEFIDDVISIKVNNITKPVLNICFDLFKKNKYKDINEFWKYDNENFWKFIYQIITIKGSSIYRKELIASLKNFEIHLYGDNNWPDLKCFYHNSINHGNLMSEEYQKYKVNINISALQLETAINNRVFDIFAAKAFVLSDYKSDIKFLFPNCFEYITYNGVEELNSKIEYYLTHESERKEIIGHMHEEILKKHTYGNRVNEILEKLSR